MNACLFTLVALIASPAVKSAPISYVVAGETVSAAVDAADGERVTVAALDAPLARDLAVEGRKITFDAPETRARLLLSIHRPTDTKRAVGLVAVYPRDAMLWNADRYEVCAVGTPAWFNAWACAVGMKPNVASTAEALRRHVGRRKAEHRVIVCGRDARLDDLTDCFDLAQAYEANVVILDAAWYGERVAANVAMKLDALPDPLARLDECRWRGMLSFDERLVPGLVIANRARVAHDDETTLVELFTQRDHPRVVLASYVPWDQRLGRSEAADASLAALIRETAGATRPSPFQKGVAIHGGPQRWPDEQRPVLSHVTLGNGAAETLQIVDLRGDVRSDVQFRRIRQLVDSVERSPLLILGDDPALRSVRGLPKPGFKIEKDVNKDDRRIIWLNADVLPPSATEQHVLMRVLTSFEVPLTIDTGD